LIPRASLPLTNPTTIPPTKSHADNGVIGYVTQHSTSKPSGQYKPKDTLTVTTQNTSPPATTLGKTFEINTVQSTTISKYQQPGSKKKGKGNAKKNSPQQGKPKNQPTKDTHK
jgi:hypothetical protein